MNAIRKIASFIELMTFFVALFFATGCSKSESVKIGVSQCSTDDWREKMNDEILRESMLVDSVDVEICSAEDDVERQIADINRFIDEGYDVIAVAPIEAHALTGAVHRAMDAGIPVLLFDRETEDDRYTAYIGADNRAIGQLAARQLSRDMPDGAKILEVRGLDGSTPADGRSRGFRDGIDSLGDKFEIVESIHGRWIDSTAAAEVEKVLKAHPEINMIYAHNDRMAIAASHVKYRLGRDSVVVYGIDAAPQIGIKAVADGTLDATFFYPTEGEFLLRTAVDMAHGKMPAMKKMLLPSPEPVTRENAELLVIQSRAIDENTDKIVALHERINNYLTLQSTQRIILIGAVTILILMAVLLFVIMRLYWSHRSHRIVLSERNSRLSQQRDELKRLNEELRNVTATRMIFFTNVSHDLRTPLTLIADPVEEVSKADNLTPRQKTMMALANKNVKILQRLINQILDFRTAENNKMILNANEVNLSEYIKDWSEAFGEAARHRHLNLSVVIEPTAKDVTLGVDVEKMERVFFNLLSNAFKFTPSNGKVTVEVSADSDNWVLRVTDTGCGIKSDALTLIFDRFFKSDRVNPSGSGIGLALTKAFVELHEGTITVESIEGEGTKFEVRLPIKHVSGVLPADHQTTAITSETIRDELADIEVIPEPESDSDEHRPTALIIDDNPDIRALVQIVLSDRFRVIQASGGAGGIRMASKFIPDVIICDIMMPDIDGLETCRRLKSEVTTSHIPVLMLTACADDRERITGYNAGADGYLSKPFNSEVLISRIDSLLANRAILAGIRPGEVEMGVEVTSKESNVQPTSPMGVDLDNDFFRKFVDLIKERMADAGLSVEEVAAEMGLSRVQFYRKIKALTNYSPAEMIRIIRLKHADKLIKTTDNTISEIAYSVGFSSPGYFTKCYRDYFSETPGDARRRTSGAK